MKRLALMMVLLSALLGVSQTTTQVTGTVKDLSQAAVTSGKVVFTLVPSADSTISGTARFSPLAVTCLITANGSVKALDGVSNCVVTQNGALSPSGTSYLVQICPYKACTSSFYTQLYQSSVDISQLTPTPATMPLYGLVSTGGNFTIQGFWTFSNGLTSTAITTGQFNVSQRFCGTPFSATDLGAQCNSAISVVSAAGGGEVIIAGTGTTNYNTGLALQSNVRLHGQTNTTAINFTGTGNAISGSSVSNIEIDHLTITNGTNGTAYVAGQNAVRLDNVSGFKIHDLSIPATAGQYSIFSYNGSHGVIEKNDIGPTTFCGICLGVGNDDVRILTNYVHDITTTVAGVGYGIAAATIAENAGQTQNYSNNVIVANNTVKNVPLWEAYDAHGGTNITFKDNYAENVFVCILANLNSVGVNSPAAASIRGIYIEGNTCKQGTATLNGRGIVVGGDNQAFFGNDAWVIGNFINGFGAGSAASASTLGPIDIRTWTNATVKDNRLLNYSQQGIFMQDVHGADIVGNYCYDMFDHFPASVITACVFPNTGNWDITVADNHQTPSTLAKSPNYFLRTGSVVNNLKLGRNYIQTAQSGDYFFIGTNAYFASAPTTTNSLMLKNGDPIFDQFGRVGWFASAGRGFWGLSTLTITTCNMSSSVNPTQMTGCTGGSGSTTFYHWLPPGANISVAGAGAAGGVLNAMVISDDGTTVTLDTAASTTVTAANVTYQVPTIVSANQYLNEWETRSLPSPVQGLQWVFDYPNAAYTNGSAFGFEFGTNNGGFYGTYNVRQTTRNTDSWTSTNAAQSNYLLDLTNSGLCLYYATAGTGPNTKAGFWGTALQCTTNAGLALNTHLNQTASNTIAGTIAVSASTSGARSFPVAYNSAPACTITPITDPTAVGVWWVTTSTSAVTANVKTSGTITFNYICVGNPN